MSQTSAPNETRGILAIVLGALCFSTAILFTRMISGMGAAEIAFSRALVGFLFFCALLPRYREPLHFAAYRPARSALVGLGLAVGATATLYVYAIQHTTAANAVLLNNTSTLYVALLAPWLLHEPRPRYIWLSLGLAAVGLVCITDPAHLDWRSDQAAGIAAGALSGLSYAAMMLLSRTLRDRVSGITQTWWSTGIAALVALPFALSGLNGQIIWANALWLVALGVISLGLPYLLYFLGLQRVNAQVVSIVALLEPVSGILIGCWLFHEIPDPIGWVGIGLILAGIILVTRRGKDE